MKLFVILAAIWTIGNASTTRQNVMGQQKMVGLMGQGMMENPITMTFQGIPMEMQRINVQETMKIPRSQKMSEPQRLGLFSDTYRTQVNQNEQQMHNTIRQAEQLKMQQPMDNINTVLQRTGSMVNLDEEKLTVYQMAKQMVRQVQHDELVQMQRSIKQIQQQAQNTMTTGSTFQQMAQQQALEEVQRDVMEQQEEIMSERKTYPMNQLQQTLQVVIEAEIALQNFQNQQNVQNPTTLPMTPRMYNLQFQMQQLIKQNNMELTKAIIAKHERKVRQIQLQQQFLAQQIEELKLRQVPQQNIQPQQLIQPLQTMQQRMQQQQHQLMVELMTHQIVIYQFQQMLVSQQNEFQQQMVFLQTVEYLKQEKYPIMRMIPSMNMPSMNMPSMNMPSMNMPSMNMPSMNMPSMNMPSMNMPSMNKPSVNEPSMNMRLMNMPQMMQA